MMKITFLSITLTITALCHGQEQGLKDAFKDSFLVGTSVNSAEIYGTDKSGVRLMKHHFNSIVAENCMKSEVIHPSEDTYDFTLADRFVELGEVNGMFIIGHCLVWHSQLASWFPYDSNGNYVSAEVLKQRLKEHITTIVSRYKGRIHGWDVVNEAILEDGSYRNSPFYEILGEEFIPLAFRYAHEADPDAELYLNDFGMNVPGRRNAYIRLVRALKDRGIRIDAIGMQGHMGMDYPDFSEFEESINAFADTGIKVMITEWDMSALPTVNTGADVSETEAYQEELNPYPDGLPDDVSEEWNQRMKMFLELFLKHSDKISRVTVWGICDKDSWRNDWPVAGRRDYPLLFDRTLQPKPFIKEYLTE